VPPDSKIPRFLTITNYRHHPHKPIATPHPRYKLQSLYYQKTIAKFPDSSNKDNYNKQASNYTKEINPSLKK
jgi:hypothetical protein